MKLDAIKAWFRQASFYAEEAYNAPYRSAIARAQREQDDLFMLLVFSE
ncbi:MAG: DNA helicase, partial [Alkalimonas sp.]|nr:DNA helicase [Alkalimonas sp.]